MYKRFVWLFIVMVSMLGLAGCGSGKESQGNTNASSGEKTEIMVMAAASLTDALQELKTSFESEHPTTTVTYSFGGSGKLAQQIEQGAPADVFLSASKKDMDKLQEKSLIAADTRGDFTKNELVLVAPKNTSLQVTSFENMKPEQLQRLAVGEPESVPAGRYTKETMEKLGTWTQYKDKLVLGKDVRQVLTYVESGNADAGVVYASDAKTSQKVVILAQAKPEWHKPITYPGAVVAGSKHVQEAEEFLTYVKGEKGQAIFKKYGFQ